MNDVRVLVVDDHESFRHAVAAVIDETIGFIVVASAESGEESLVEGDAYRAAGRSVVILVSKSPSGVRRGRASLADKIGLD